MASRSTASCPGTYGAPRCSLTRARSVASGTAWLPANATLSTTVRAPSVITARTATGTCAGGGVGLTISTADCTFADAKPRRWYRFSIICTSPSSLAPENGWPSRSRRPDSKSANGTEALPEISNVDTLNCWPRFTAKVNRGQQFRVSTFEISGNASVPLADFESGLRLRDGQPFSGARLDGDVQMIENL